MVENQLMNQCRQNHNIPPDNYLAIVAVLPQELLWLAMVTLLDYRYSNQPVIFCLSTGSRVSS